MERTGDAPGGGAGARRAPGAPAGAVLRAAVVADAAVFLTAALLNLGTTIPLGFTAWRFPAPVWQAGVGEAIIGLVLLAAAVTGRVGVAWAAFWLSVVGILFGLSSPRVRGPAREVHVLLVPLAGVVFALLVWQRQRGHRRGQRAGAARARRRTTSIAIGGLLAAVTVAFALASLIHSGVALALGPLTIGDPFPGATIPEAIIALALAIGAAAVLAHWPAARPLALATSLFSLLLTLYGFTVTVRTARTGDITYHLAVLVALLAIVGWLLLPARRHEVPRS